MTNNIEKRHLVVSQVRELPEHARTNLLSYLMGYFQSNEEFIQEVDFWLNDPKFGWLSITRRELDFKEEPK